MSRRDKIILALSLAAVVCAGTALQITVPADMRLIPFVLAFAAYRAGTLLPSARAAKGGE